MLRGQEVVDLAPAFVKRLSIEVRKARREESTKRVPFASRTQTLTSSKPVVNVFIGERFGGERRPGEEVRDTMVERGPGRGLAARWRGAERGVEDSRDSAIFDVFCRERGMGMAN